MHLLLLSITKHSTIRLEELAGLATAIAGAALFAGAMTPMGRRGGQLVGGILLAAAGVLVIIALHWGTP
jgi:hypothetical protein